MLHSTRYVRGAAAVDVRGKAFRFSSALENLGSREKRAIFATERHQGCLTHWLECAEPSTLSIQQISSRNPPPIIGPSSW